MKQTNSKTACSILTTSDEFKKCHHVIDPKKYVDNCVADSCRRQSTDNNGPLCCYVVAYALQCAIAGVDVDVHTISQCGMCA